MQIAYAEKVKTWESAVSCIVSSSRAALRGHMATHEPAKLLLKSKKDQYRWKMLPGVHRSVYTASCKTKHLRRNDHDERLAKRIEEC